MKAARYYGKHDLRIEEAPEPPKPGHGEVVVAPTFCGICGTDLHEFESGPIFTPKTPNASARRSAATDSRPRVRRPRSRDRTRCRGDQAATESPSSRRSARATTIMASATYASLDQGRRSSGSAGHGADG